MIINCARCNRPFQSALVDNAEAWRELNLHLMKHVEKNHPKTFRRITNTELPELIMALTEFYTMSALVVIPESEEWLMDHAEELQDKVMLGMGFDPEEEEEEEEEEDGAVEPIIIPTSDPAEPEMSKDDSWPVVGNAEND